METGAEDGACDHICIKLNMMPELIQTIIDDLGSDIHSAISNFDKFEDLFYEVRSDFLRYLEESE